MATPEQGGSPEKSPTIQKVVLKEPAAQLYWARLSRLVQLRSAIDTDLSSVSTLNTHNLYRSPSNEENNPGYVNIRPSDLRPFQYSPGLRQGVLRGIYGAWRQLHELGHGDLADAVLKYDRERQGIEPRQNFKPKKKRK